MLELGSVFTCLADMLILSSCLCCDHVLRAAPNQAHSLMEGFVLPNQREMTASKSSTPFSQKEFEALAMLEHLQVQLL